MKEDHAASDIAAAFLAELAAMKLAGDWSARLEAIAQAASTLDPLEDASEPLVCRQHVESAAGVLLKIYGGVAEEHARTIEQRMRGSFAKLVRVELQRRDRLAGRSEL